ncbi:MAG TPA: hypothetical protein VJ963_15400 [Bacteroidales bacterium]|nr:hypothetical protein [Bacteroidales bacterium]
MNTQKLTNCFFLLVLHWLPRVLSILLIIFLSLFSFDLFGQGTGFWRTAAAFLIHNVPSFFLIIVLVFSWRWSWIGGTSYILLGLLYILLFINRNVVMFIDLSLFTTGFLFLLDWFFRRDIIRAQKVCRGE